MATAALSGRASRTATLTFAGFASGADEGSGTHNFFALDRQSRRVDLWRPLPSAVARREQRRFHLPASPVVPMTAAAPTIFSLSIVNRGE